MRHYLELIHLFSASCVCSNDAQLIEKIISSNRLVSTSQTNILLCILWCLPGCHTARGTYTNIVSIIARVGSPFVPRFPLSAVRGTLRNDATFDQQR